MTADARMSEPCLDARYLRRTHAMNEITALMSNIVVIGKKNLNPGRSMTMSPGRRNSGRRLTQDQARPRKMRLAPRVMSRRFISHLRQVARARDGSDEWPTE